MNFAARQEITQSDGLRNVLRGGYPSMWGRPAKAMMEYKGPNNLERASDVIPIEYHGLIKQTCFKISRES